MKSFFTEKPKSVISNYTATTSLVVYNVEEVTREMEGETITEWTADTIEVKNPCDYASVVSALIRTKYTADQVEAIILNHGDGNVEHEAQYNELQEWRREAKRIAHLIELRK